MSIDLSRWPQADDILDAALALPPAERVAYVARAAKGDAALRAALEAVIVESLSADPFLAPGSAWSGRLAESLSAEAPDDEPRLAPGTRIEEYEVTRLIGRGGMGEVYRAVDTRLHRDVALKVLPDRFAHDPDRHARFRREARVLATISDPGIAAIYGVAEGAGVEALVLELVDGPTLAERLAEGPLPMNEVVSLSRALVDAIAAAHARGILHRDLKPANIKLLPGGGVKVLDFGLAKALVGDAGPAATGPTDLTGQGPARLLGTLSYMSPEQLRGETLDARADIWAFGCVLFEMLTGTRAFGGDAQADVIARVLEREPAFGLLPPGTPPALRRLLRHTLDKDPRRRLAHIDDARLDFDDAVTESAPAEAHATSTAWRWWAAAAAVALVAGIGIVAVLLRGGEDPPVMRFEVPFPPGERPPLNYQPSLALSPDGATLVFRSDRAGVSRLYRRRVDELTAAELPGTEGATSPFFSPDGAWVGFDVSGMLKRTPVGGGQILTIAEAPGTATATWLADDTVVFATNTGRVLQRVPVNGGAVTALTTLDTARGDTMHLLPQAMPDGNRILFTVVGGTTRQVAVLRLDTGETTMVAEGTHGRYVPTGHLVVLRAGALWSLPFDLRGATVTGPGHLMVNAVAQTDSTVGHYDVSATGALAYLPPQPDTEVQRLVWIDRGGRHDPLTAEPRNYSRVSLSADGSRLAVTLEQDGNTDVWVGEPSRAVFSRLTFEPAIDTMPTVSPDGRFVAFRSEREGPGLFRRDAQGAGPAERLTSTSGPIHSPYSWTPDGKTLLLAVFRGFTNQAIAQVTPPSTEVEMLLDGPFAQLDPQVSPDGRWLAYESDETGKFEIYVRPYPDVRSGRWQVSPSGGVSPRWSHDGRELFFFRDGALYAARVDTGRGFSAAAPRRLFDVRPVAGSTGTDYEVSADDRRFLFILPAPEPPPPPASMVWVQNWARELRQATSAR